MATSQIRITVTDDIKKVMQELKMNFPLLSESEIFRLALSQLWLNAVSSRNNNSFNGKKIANFLKSHNFQEKVAKNDLNVDKFASNKEVYAEYSSKYSPE